MLPWNRFDDNFLAKANLVFLTGDDMPVSIDQYFSLLGDQDWSVWLQTKGQFWYQYIFVMWFFFSFYSNCQHQSLRNAVHVNTHSYVCIYMLHLTCYFLLLLLCIPRMGLALEGSLCPLQVWRQLGNEAKKELTMPPTYLGFLKSTWTTSWKESGNSQRD